ncbi:AAA family ATPase [Brucella sp. 22210]|uniref:AAA family ATPase n=1 Tax=Brucella sp. 22210 TaxID=3453892 RepID=UPI003F843569
MKPVRLIMQAFGPYSEQETVDFREAVDAGLFGIYGQTGSGKSTIFSAMTFALFGEAAKAEQETPSLRSDNADADRPTEVEFVFDIADRRYVVRRRPEQSRPKQRGNGETRDPHEAWLFDATGMALDDITPERPGKVIEEKKVGPVGKAIEDLLGYGADQFRQIVLLPQGRFEAFLAADTKARLGILRDLFDVSLYRRLAARMKADAEAVERQFRTEREVFTRRLNAEGFESLDALKSGIEESNTSCTDLAAVEAIQREAQKKAHTELETAKALDRLFETAIKASNDVNTLQQQASDIDAIAKKLQSAERARLLLDVERHVLETTAELAAAETALGVSVQKLAAATAAETLARTAHEAEEAKASEIEQLRRGIEAMQRHQKTLERSIAISQDVAQATDERRKHHAALQKGLEAIAALLTRKQTQQDSLKTARLAASKRQELLVKRSQLEHAITHAEAVEKAQADAASSKANVETLSARHRGELNAAGEAKNAFIEAERQLSSAQALHLASKLVPGEPCPVCGANDHPMPATGNPHHAGLYAAFRQTKELWEQRQSTERDTHANLVSAQSILVERQNRVSELNPAERPLAELRAAFAKVKQDIEALGPILDIALAEGQFEETETRKVAAEQIRDQHRTALQTAETELASAQVRLEEMLSDIPEEHREAARLAELIASRADVLTRREDARKTARETATTARETALSSMKEQESAQKRMDEQRLRRSRAQDEFASRLEAATLTHEEYLALKPAFATIDQDREIVENYRRNLFVAEDTARKATAAVATLERPALPPFEMALQDADVTLQKAQTDLATAAARRDQLNKLLAELADTINRLEKAEAESGPLRELAALFDSKNSQNLDLETFAIGAMFDQVLIAANQHLNPMSGGRYTLERALEGSGRGRRGLGIQVHDTFTGKPRPTATLSGGESFIAALALALGLADVVESANGKVRLDTIFIDEGFGSLDTENGAGTLDQVLQALNTLVSQNRAVGLISHVPLVQEAIPNGFYIRKDLSGSRVEQRGMV